MNSNIRKHRVLIIGSGPVGAITASLALEKNFDVTMVDIGSTEREVVEHNELGLKTIDGSVHPYDLGQHAKLDFGDLGYRWRTSKGKFGFSTVWGGTWVKFNSLAAPNWVEAYSKVKEIIADNSQAYMSQCSCTYIHFNNIGGSSSLPVLVNKTEVKPTIWSTNKLISQLSKNMNFKYIIGNVIKFQENVVGVSVITDKGNLTDFDLIYLCCGPVGNAYLVLNSVLKPTQIVLKDTQITYIPFLYRKKAKSCKEISNFPIGSASVLNKEGGVETYFQVYPHVNEYLEQILGKFPSYLRSMLNTVLRLLFSRIGIALGYRNQSNSNSISLNAGPTMLVKELAPEQKISKLIFLISTFSKLISLGLLPISIFARFGSPGDSYHLGMANNVVQSEYGSVEGFNRVFALGSIALPNLEPGPITYSAMAQAVIGFNYSLKKLPKL